MKRVATLLLMLLALPLLLVLMLALVGWTATGTRWLLQLLPEDLPVTLEYRSGHLMGRLELADITLQAEEAEVQIGHWQSQLRPGCLWQSRVCVEQLHLGDVVVNLLGSSAEPAAAAERLELPALVTPVPIELGELRLDRLSISSQGELLTRLDVRLGAAWSDDSLQIQGLAVELAGLLALHGEGQLSLRESWPLQWSGGVQLGSAGELPESLRGQTVTLTLDGDLAALQADAGLQRPVALHSRLLLDALDPLLPFALSARVEPLSAADLAALPEWPDDMPALALHEALTLEADGDLTSQVLALSTGLALPGYPDSRLAAQVAHRQGLLEVNSLSFSAGDSLLQLTGQLDYDASGLDWRGQLEARDLQIPPLSEQLRGSLEGSLAVSAYWRDPRWGLDISSADLAGIINDLPATLRGNLQLDSEQWLAGGDLLLEANGASLALQRNAVPGARAQLLLSVPDLSRWETAARGRLELQAELGETLDSLSLRGHGEGVRWADTHLPALRLEAELSIQGEGEQRGSLQLSAPELAGMALEELTLQLSGSATAPRLALRSRGELEGGLVLEALRSDSGWLLQLQEAGFTTPLGPLRTDAVVTLDWQGEQGTLSAHCWQLPELQLCAQPWRLGASGEGRAVLGGDLSALEPLLPADLSLAGALSGDIQASWSAQAGLSLAASLRSDEGVITQWLAEGESASWTWERASLGADFTGRGLEVQAELIREAAPRLTVQLALRGEELDQLSGELALRDLQLGPLAPFVGPLSHLEGTLQGDVRLSGRRDAPLADGRIQWRQGGLGVHGNPTVIEQVEGALVLEGGDMRLTGDAKVGGGDLRWSGHFALEPDLQASLQITGENNRLLYPPDTEVTVTPDLQLRWQPGLLRLRGGVDVPRGRLAYEHLPEGGVDVSADVVEVDYAGNLLGEEQAMDLDMKMRLRIHDRFLVEGKGVQIRVGGDLQVEQAPGSPLQLFGNLNVLDGELEAYGQQLKVQRGQVSFVGLPGNPELNLRATREIRAEDIVAGVRVSGTLEMPQIEIYTNPVTSQTEALSYLIRGRGMDAGGGTDSTALAISLGAGLVNRSALVEGLNRLPGISDIEFGTEGSDGETAATVSGYLGERLYLSYGVGLYEPVNVLTARFFLQTRLWLEVVSRLENSVDLYYSFDID